MLKKILLRYLVAILICSTEDRVESKHVSGTLTHCITFLA